MIIINSVESAKQSHVCAGLVGYMVICGIIHAVHSFLYMLLYVHLLEVIWLLGAGFGARVLEFGAWD